MVFGLVLTGQLDVSMLNAGYPVSTAADKACKQFLAPVCRPVAMRKLPDRL
jgi:hypothetical protein